MQQHQQAKSQLNTSNHSCDKADFRVPRPTPISDHVDPKMKKVTFSSSIYITCKNVSSIQQFFVDIQQILEP